MDRTQLNGLTGLRFFAAMAVVLYHLRIYFVPDGDVLAIFSYGFTGVSFFFILSGFVLTWSHRADVSSGRFYWSRVARIWPLHVLTMLVAIWVPSNGFASSSGWSAAPFALTLTQAWIPASPILYSFNTVSWSLSCEAFFYLLFPILFKSLGSNVRVTRVAGLVVAASIITGLCLAVIASMTVADYLLATMPFYRLGEFILGMCLAETMKRGWRPKIHLGHAAGLLVVLAAALFLIPLLFNGRYETPVIVANLTMVPGFVAVIAASAGRDLSHKRSFLGSAALTRLGRWSFALYLVHELVFKMTEPLVSHMQLEATFVFALLAVFGCIALSGVLHEFVEKPADKWLRSLGTNRPPSTPTTAGVHHSEN
ncbi:UNVERIFIED_ORG: peptidoglycan/LPS O-acetylase OafA/YrhL [Arthrobacter sp. UYEF1]